jgi:hypothetical protein
LDISIALLQLLLLYRNWLKTAVPKLRKLALSWSVEVIHVFLQGRNNILSTILFQFPWQYQFLFLDVQLHVQVSLSHRPTPNSDTKNLFSFKMLPIFMCLDVSTHISLPQAALYNHNCTQMFLEVSVTAAVQLTF